jgi:hypothetical protein
MRSFTDEAMDAIVAGTAIAVGAVEILCDSPVRVWGGPWATIIDGEDYLGVGDRGLVQVGSAALGSAAQNLTLELSGVDPAALDVLDADEVRGAPVVLRRMIFNGSGTRCLDVHVFRRGRLDQLITEEMVGGSAIIRAMVEGAARGLGRRGGRMRTDADQRLVEATDGGMRHVSYAGQKMLYWGGKVPAAARTALGGVSAGTSSASAA